MQARNVATKPCRQTACSVPKRSLPRTRAEPINPAIDKDSAKVVTTVNTGDLGKKGVFCRCWRSGSFPNCDGSHMKHNEETGDNVGPLIVSKTE